MINTSNNSFNTIQSSLTKSLVVLSLLFCLFLCTSVFAAVIQIDSIDELQLIGNDVAYPLNGEYELSGDIDASDTINWNSGSGFKPIGTSSNRFVGKFNGNGHKITGLYINRPTGDYVGLFGYIGPGGEVKDLGIENCWVKGQYYVGGLVGYNDGTISDSYSIGSIEGTYYIGGLVGNNHGTISDSYSTGSVSGSQIIGGLVGTNDGTISNSYSTCTAQGEYTVGGLVGNNYGTISDSYGTGSVLGNDYIGGLVAINVGVVTNSYSVGLVTGVSDVGGLIGENWDTITSSYWDTETSGQSSSAGGEGKTTAELKQQSTFVGWDFTNVWNIMEDVTYPYLLGFSYKPEITISGGTEITAECGEEYIDAGATAWDKPDGDLTSQIQVVNNVNSNAVGDYTVEYSVTDSNSNTSVATRLVHITDTIGPVITLNGANPMILECNSSFDDPGATAIDVCDGLEATVQVISNNVDITTRGAYQVVYGAEDSEGNYSEVTREVRVQHCYIYISAIVDLQKIGNDPAYPLNGEYILNDDIDASDTVNWNSGAGFKPIGTDADPFTGNFDGNSYKITGLYINRPTEDNIGLFGYVDSGVVVNVGIEDCQIVGKYEVGGLVGRNYGTISDSYSTGSVQGKYSIGGLVGENYDTLSNSYSTGSVKGGGEVGGLVGYNDGTIFDSYSTGSIQGEYDVGGLVDLNENIVTNCYSTGLVIGSGEVGGLVGYDEGGTVSNSYWDTQTSGLTTSAGGEGKTIEEMRQQATFTGWDFTTVWAIEEDSSYPYLQELGGNQIVYHQTAETIEISNLEELSKIGLDSAYPWWWNYELVADIDASDTINWNEGKGFNPLLLTGHFNGNGHVIQGLYINRPDEDKVGLFSYLSETGELNNIGIEDCQIVGYDYVGGLVGDNYGTISDGYSIGSIEGTYYIGGLVGYNDGTISDSYSTGSVSGSQIIGGLVGTNDGTISGSYSTCSGQGEYDVGGLVGDNYGTISDSYSTGSVYSSDYVGGLVAINVGVVTNSYSVGLVTGVSDVGGLIGENWGTITSSYWDTETSGQSSSAGGEGKTTAEMKQQATFVGWDFTNIWNIVEDVTYPYLLGFLYKPEITILGGTEITIECSSVYEDAGATAWDIPDGDLTSQIQVVNNVNSNAVGDYTVDYSVTDSSSNTSTAQRIVHVIDTTPPEITLNGDNPMTVECDSVFVDPAAEATDTCDSEVSVEVLSNNVDTSQTGDYYVVYRAVDDSGNFAEKTREVIVDCGGEGVVEGTTEGVVEGSAEGEGMSEVIQIDSIEELQLIGNDAAYPLNGEYELTQDIDASDTINWNSGSGFKPIGTDSDLFLGKFTGNGYKITGLYINRSNEDYIGLFGYVASGGVVENVGMEDCQIVGRYYVGDLIGHNAGTMSNSYSTGSTSGSDYVGGLVGVNSNTVYNSYSTGSIQGEYDVGGLVGDNYGTISNSYSTGSVSGIGAVGGLLGYNISIITNCYSACLVTGDGNIGGLVGYDGGGSTVSNSYWDTETSGQSSSAGGTGKTTAEMKQQATFVGWDFTNIWAIIEEQSYPYFLWQTPPPEGEGSVEGEGIQEGSPEGTVEGSTEGTVEGTPEGVVEGTTEGVVEGIVEGIPEGAMEGTVEGTPEGVVEGTTEGVVEGVVEGIPEGSAEGTTEGTGEGTTEGITEGEGTAEGSTEGTTEGEMPPHSADPNGDGMIDLSELLRVIQFFNMGGYHCEAGTEDGYAGGYDGDKTCTPHASDYDEQDWTIDLGELLRLIQFFNMGGYYPCPGIGEDGYCPGTE